MNAFPYPSYPSPTQSNTIALAGNIRILIAKLMTQNANMPRIMQNVLSLNTDIRMKIKLNLYSSKFYNFYNLVNNNIIVN
jgi:hypothetical protein